MSINSTTVQPKISKIEITNDAISARGGLTLFLRYLENTKVFELIEYHLGKMKGPKKGITTREFLIQFMSFIMDGSHTSISFFGNRTRPSGFFPSNQTLLQALCTNK